jgi:hypothetical protein
MSRRSARGRSWDRPRAASAKTDRRVEILQQF